MPIIIIINILKDKFTKRLNITMVTKSGESNSFA